MPTLYAVGRLTTGDRASPLTTENRCLPEGQCSPATSGRAQSQKLSRPRQTEEVCPRPNSTSGEGSRAHHRPWRAPIGGRLTPSQVSESAEES